MKKTALLIFGLVIGLQSQLVYGACCAYSFMSQYQSWIDPVTGVVHVNCEVHCVLPNNGNDDYAILSAETGGNCAGICEVWCYDWVYANGGANGCASSSGGSSYGGCMGGGYTTGGKPGGSVKNPETNIIKSGK